MKRFAAAGGVILLSWGCSSAKAGAPPQHVAQLPVPLQPLAQQVRRVATALSYLGQPLTAEDSRAIDDAISLKDEERAVLRLQTTPGTASTFGPKYKSRLARLGVISSKVEATGLSIRLR